MPKIKITTKIISGLGLGLAVLLFAATLGLQMYHPARAHAAITGNGDSQTPYQVTTCDDLQNIGAAGADSQAGLYYLAGDIDCSATPSWNGGKGFKPIQNFHGTLDGRGHTISGLRINRPDEDNVGLFDNLNGAMVTNLAVDYLSTITGRSQVGTVAGTMQATNVYGVKSTATIHGFDSVGGIAGYTTDGGNLNIERTSFLGVVTSSNGTAGGMIGLALFGFTLRDVMVNGNISGVDAADMIGNVNQSCGNRYIYDAMGYGTVTGIANSGGLIGEALNTYCGAFEIHDSVASAILDGPGNIGGLIGRSGNASLTISNSFMSNAVGLSCIADPNDAIITSDCAAIGDNAQPNDQPYAHWDYTNTWVDTGLNELVWPVSNLTGPTVPQTFAAVQGTTQQDINISWAAPATQGDYDIFQYQIQLKRHSDTWGGKLEDVTVNNSTFSYIFNSENMGTQYDVRVRAITQYASSPWANVQYSTPDPDTVSITTCQQLQDLNNDADNHWKNISLANNINCAPDQLGGSNFVPLGGGGAWTNDYYRGDFNGNGHTISNLTIDVSSWGAGLFTETQFANLHDVIFDGGSISCNNGECGVLVGYAQDTEMSNITTNVPIVTQDYSGGIAGEVEYDYGRTVTLSNLVSTGDVEVSDYEGGGLFGELDVYNGNASVTLTDSHATGAVNSNSEAGGLIGAVYVENDDYFNQPASSLTIQNSYTSGGVSGGDQVGGIVGYTEVYNDGFYSDASLTFENVHATGNLTSLGGEVGGIVGYLEVEDPGDTISIDQSYSTGSITANDSDAGGLVGIAYVYNEENDNTDPAILNITSSFSTGSITGTGYIGGIAGSISTNSDGYLNSPAVVNIDKTYSTGDLLPVSDSTEYVGGIVGDAEIEGNSNEMNITRSYASGNITTGPSGSYAGGLAGYVFVQNSDGDNTTEASFNINDSFATSNITGSDHLGGIIADAEVSNFTYVNSDAVINVGNVYSGGNITATGDNAGGIIGNVENMTNDGENVYVVNSFSGGQVSANTNGYGLVGGTGYIQNDAGLQMYNNYFVVDGTPNQPTQAAYTMIDGWDTVDSNNVFRGNSTNPPYNYLDDQNWDFDNTWQEVDNNYPSLRDLPVVQTDAPAPQMTDLNGDGIDDGSQPYVMGLTNGLNGKTEVIELSSDCTIDGSKVAVKKESQFAVQDAGFDYADSLLNFAATCSSSPVNVKIYYYDVSGSFTVRKYNSTNNTYATVPGSSLSTRTIDGHQVLVASYQLTDNGPLDLNPTIHDIEDPVGLGTAVIGAPNTGFGYNGAN